MPQNVSAALHYEKRHIRLCLATFGEVGLSNTPGPRLSRCFRRERKWRMIIVYKKVDAHLYMGKLHTNTLSPLDIHTLTYTRKRDRQEKTLARAFFLPYKDWKILQIRMCTSALTLYHTHMLQSHTCCNHTHAAITHTRTTHTRHAHTHTYLHKYTSTHLCLST